MDFTKANEIRERAKYLEDQRSLWDSLHMGVQQYILPDRGLFSTKGERPNTGEQRNSKIINATATWGLRVLAAGMQGGLTSPARPWFRLTTPFPDLNEFRVVREWLSAVEKRLYAAMANSNFYGVQHSCYWDEAGFGNSVMAGMKVNGRPVFMRFPVGQYSLAEGVTGTVDTVYRRFWMTAVNMARQFGKNHLSVRVKDCLEKRPFEVFEVLMAYEPRNLIKPGLVTSDNLPWATVYMEMANEEPLVLEESGTRVKAVWASRWDVNGDDVYGRSPCHEVLPHVKMLQQQERSSLRIWHHWADPMLRMPASYKGRINAMVPGAHVYDDTAGRVEPIYQPAVNPQHLEARISRVVMEIREGLYNDLFLMLQEHPNMTATEVVERKEEKLILLGPVIERQFHERLDPVIDWLFDLLLEEGELPPPPPELRGMDLKVDYISLLAQAQKMTATHGLRAFTGYVGELAKWRPDVLDVVDFDEAAREFGDAMGVPPKLLRDPKVIGEERQARAQRQQQMEQAAMVQQGVQAARELSETNLEGNSALGAVAQQAMGGQ